MRRIPSEILISFPSSSMEGGSLSILMSFLVPGYGRGFIWRPPIRVGASVIIVAGDIRGNATGGGKVMTIGSGMLFTNLTGAPIIGQCPPQNGTELTYPARNE